MEISLYMNNIQTWTPRWIKSPFPTKMVMITRSELFWWKPDNSLPGDWRIVGKGKPLTIVVTVPDPLPDIIYSAECPGDWCWVVKLQGSDTEVTVITSDDIFFIKGGMKSGKNK